VLITCPESLHENGLMEWNTQPLDCKSDLISPSTDLYYVPDTVHLIYFLSDREHLLAYHLKWRKLRLLMPLYRSVDVHT